MKRSNIRSLALVFLISLASSLSNAMEAHNSDPIDGKSELTICGDSNFCFGVKIKKSGNSIFGRVDGAHNRIALKIINSDEGETISGFFQKGATAVHCHQDLCNGEVDSKPVNITITRNGVEFAGKIGGHDVYALNLEKKIILTAYGSVELKQKETGEYKGKGWTTPKMEPRVSVSLKGQGSLSRIDQPALFIIYLIGSFLE